PLRRDTQGGERLFHVCHEACRPAEIYLRIAWHADLAQDQPRQVAGRVEIVAHLVLRAWPAVADMAAAVREHADEAADFGGEGMMLPIASPVEPQDLPWRAGRGQRVQHRQNRRGTDSSAEQYHRPLSGLQNEASARRTDVEGIAHPDMLAQI